jgi:hypothetical protein
MPDAAAASPGVRSQLRARHVAAHIAQVKIETKRAAQLLGLPLRTPALGPLLPPSSHSFAVRQTRLATRDVLSSESRQIFLSLTGFAAAGAGASLLVWPVPETIRLKTSKELNIVNHPDCRKKRFH